MLSKLFKNFQKKEKLPLDYFYTTDLHSHLIPNIDDGVKTLEESVEIIKNLKKKKRFGKMMINNNKYNKIK